MSFFNKVLNLGADKPLRQFTAITDQVTALEPSIAPLSDSELRAKTAEFRARLADGETLDDLLVEAYAVVREAAVRVLGQRHFDVQILAGAALHRGMVAEMKTGEGKTLVSTLPVYLNALTGAGVHVITSNDYLASRDAEWMGSVHRFLGLTVGLLVPDAPAAEKAAAYAADITYGTNNEFGFDYLRDNMVASPAGQVQRGHVFALIDEVDSILIDEARTPLIISGVAADSSKWYKDFARLVRRLQPDRDYEVDIQKRAVLTTEEGVSRVEQALGVANLFDFGAVDYVHHLDVALKAKELFARDVDYIIDHGEVKIVDEFTGRVLEGRRYSEGLHQAIEAKEGVTVNQENQTLATITLQNYFRLYDKLAGMTGTAKTEEAELGQIYNLGVLVVPTNRPIARLDFEDVVYKTERAKFDAIVTEVAEAHEANQPVLLGTVSIESSERLSRALTKAGIKHEVLNAKQHAREAEIIAQAGRSGAVTVATNMAGRGVDIMLGGNPEGLARTELKRQGVSPTDPSYGSRLAELTASFTAHTTADRELVLAAGGLYVLGTERHESRRIDNQLRGRSGRQGDPGKSRFFLSLEDELMRRFQSDFVSSLINRLNLPDDLPLEASMVSKAIERAQRQVESQNFEIRKEVLKYDEVVNVQRSLIYDWRNTFLHPVDTDALDSELDSELDHELDQVAAPVAETPLDSSETNSVALITSWISEVLTSVVDAAFPTGTSLRSGDWETLISELSFFYPTSLTQDSFFEAFPSGRADDLVDFVLDEAFALYEERTTEFGPEVMSALERSLTLTVIDNRWRDHLSDMDYLRSGIGLRAMGQRDPLVEYKNEAYNLFTEMIDSIKTDVVRYLFHLERVTEAEAQVRLAQMSAPAALPAATASSSGASSAGPASPASSNKVGRNAPCPCGSGKKFKRCHGAA